MMHWIRPWVLHMWAVFIAVVLWVQVHGEGEGTVSLDVPIQLQGLPDHMVIVNNLPSKVRITVQGLQARLKTLQEKDIFIPLDVSDLSEPGVIQRAFNLETVHLPASLSVEKIQPDRLELQIDRVVTRTVAIHPDFDLPDEWEAQMVSVQPSMVHIQGPEVWLESLTSVDTLPLKPELKAGPFELKVGIIVPAEKSVHLEEDKTQFVVRGRLARKQQVTVLPNPVEVAAPPVVPEVQGKQDVYSQVLPPPEQMPELTVEQDAAIDSGAVQSSEKEVEAKPEVVPPDLTQEEGK